MAEINREITFNLFYPLRLAKRKRLPVRNFERKMVNVRTKLQVLLGTIITRVITHNYSKIPFHKTRVNLSFKSVVRRSIIVRLLMINCPIDTTSTTKLDQMSDNTNYGINKPQFHIFFILVYVLNPWTREFKENSFQISYQLTAFSWRIL